MGTGSGSKATAGCGIFGLVGLLISIGIVAWLFVTSTDSITSSPGKDHPEQSAATTTFPADAPPPVEVTVMPARDLGTAPDVIITADGWEPGTEVTISTCLRGAGMVLGGESPCDPASAVTLPADDAGSIAGTYRVDRIVTSGGLPYDCADGSVTCVVQATGTGDNGQTASGTAAVAFQTGLPAPDLLDELGG